MTTRTDTSGSAIPTIAARAAAVRAYRSQRVLAGVCPMASDRCSLAGAFLLQLLGPWQGLLLESELRAHIWKPTMLRLASVAEDLADPGWQALRVVLVGREKVDELTERMLLDRLSGRAVVSYGCTEVTRVAEARDDELREHPGTVRRCLPLHQVRIADHNSDAYAPVGEDREILLRGPSMYSGTLAARRVAGIAAATSGGWTPTASSVLPAGRLPSSRSAQPGVDRRARHRAAQPRPGRRCDRPSLHRRYLGIAAGGFVVRLPVGSLGEDMFLAWLRTRLPACKVPRVVHWLQEIAVDRSGKTSVRKLRANCPVPLAHENRSSWSRGPLCLRRQSPASGTSSGDLPGDHLEQVRELQSAPALAGRQQWRASLRISKVSAQ